MNSPRTAEGLLDFNIPAQPLATALNAYATVSNRPALFASDMVVGHTSSAVRGRYSAEAALRLLLEGTGLAAEKLDSDLGATFVLKEIGEQTVVAPPSGMAALFSDEGYPGLVQTRIWEALCADTRTRPGNYSSLLRFQVDAAGRLYGARLLGSTGDPHRDAALLTALQQVRIDLLPPPAVVQQPLTMMILPNDGQAALECTQGSPGHG